MEFKLDEEGREGNRGIRGRKVKRSMAHRSQKDWKIVGKKDVRKVAGDGQIAGRDNWECEEAVAMRRKDSWGGGVREAQSRRAEGIISADTGILTSEGRSSAADDDDESGAKISKKWGEITQSSDSIGEEGVKRQEAAVKGEGCLPQAARYEGHERKTAITW